ncbi:unnamed protein product [Prunus armeniaca]|uniref:Uncharacterized protein n=1 Tax=Prunus armeniaca TaxID=36596 RepID=A0A6J5TQV9_PRUAR|nr:unnamed protein product [Prunus armeniaca]
MEITLQASLFRRAKQKDLQITIEFLFFHHERFYLVLIAAKFASRLIIYVFHSGHAVKVRQLPVYRKHGSPRSRNAEEKEGDHKWYSEDGRVLEVKEKDEDATGDGCAAGSSQLELSLGHFSMTNWVTEVMHRTPGTPSRTKVTMRTKHVLVASLPNEKYGIGWSG